MPTDSLRPSKKFIIRGSIAIGIVVIVLLVQTAWFKDLSKKKDKSIAITPDMTLGEVVNRDTNGNGTPDWEEKLWGLDPTVLYTNGVSNRQIIEEKKKALGVTDVSNSNLNETDKLSRELFAITAALGQSPNIDDATLAQIASELGSGLEIKPVTNKYSSKDIRTVQTTGQSLRTYHTSMTKLVAQYETGAADLNIIINALETGDMSRVSELENSAAVYNKFAKEATSIPAPLGVATYHLSMVNSFAGIAQSFSYLEQLDDNSVMSLVGIAIYKSYANKLQKALSDMEDYLVRYGIINSQYD